MGDFYCEDNLEIKVCYCFGGKTKQFVRDNEQGRRRSEGREAGLEDNLGTSGYCTRFGRVSKMTEFMIIAKVAF